MRRVWRDGLNDDINRRMFVATVESVLLYGAETWTLTANQECALDGVYTRMLRMVFDVHMGRPFAQPQALRCLTKWFVKIREISMRLAGLYVCHHEIASSLGTHRWNRSKGMITFVDQLERDAT